jgi:hypothetical protein
VFLFFEISWSFVNISAVDNFKIILLRNSTDVPPFIQETAPDQYNT